MTLGNMRENGVRTLAAWRLWVAPKRKARRQSFIGASTKKPPA
jgi:hypothetical protein